ncbi:hypothetical protein B0H67DRAFT_585080 [Lasiosphaeris hirsuta]|uniref:Uncharacterized protein n=1 Tax=Lasiosphaeris hirsuta TaxID=260670 RepID=A0AA40DQ16_9PEZI|nr:hypothetical protein B0H67DRAFT_585080 [Lasiosphaeris hirsuta]
MVSTMTITPSDGATVTAFIPMTTTETTALTPGSSSSAEALNAVPSVPLSDSLLPTPAPVAEPGREPAPLALSNTTESPTSFPTLVPAPSPSPGQDVNPSAGQNSTVEAPQGMDPMAERVMISVGSIAVFAMIGCVGWYVWRAMNKSKKNGGTRTDAFRKMIPRNMLPQRLVASIPFFKQTGWENLDDAPAGKSAESSKSGKTPPPSYHEKAKGPKSLPLGGFYGHEKAYPYHPDQQEQQPPQGASQEKPQLSRIRSLVAAEAPTLPPSSPRPLSSHPIAVSVITDNAPPIPPSLISHSPQDSFSSTSAAQFGTISTDPTSTLRSKMGPVYYNQSEFARTPSRAHDPQRRQVNRASEISSLSSGFGDGDIIVAPQPTAPAYPRTASSRYSSRFSWMSQDPSKRDTIYTQTSEDMPPRFRTVNSWVDQQTGRIKRAQRREETSTAPPVPQLPGQTGIPGIHNPPNEQGYDMMMDDEKPRRVEDMR